MNKRAIYLDVAAVLTVLVVLGAIGAFLVRNVLVQAQMVDDPGKASWSFEFSFTTDDLKNMLPGSQPGQNSEPGNQEKKYELKKIRMFAAGAKVPAANIRSYQEKFAQQDTQYIYTEITYKNAFYKQRDSELPVTIQYYTADGKLLAEIKRTAHPQKDWESALVVDKWGYEQPGRWAPGDYRVQVYFGDVLVGEAGFAVYQTATGVKGESL